VNNFQQYCDFIRRHKREYFLSRFFWWMFISPFVYIFLSLLFALPFALGSLSSGLSLSPVLLYIAFLIVTAALIIALDLYRKPYNNEDGGSKSLDVWEFGIASFIAYILTTVGWTTGASILATVGSVALSFFWFVAAFCLVLSILAKPYNYLFGLRKPSNLWVTLLDTENLFLNISISISSVGFFWAFFPLAFASGALPLPYFWWVAGLIAVIIVAADLHQKPYDTRSGGFKSVDDWGLGLGFFVANGLVWIEWTWEGSVGLAFLGLIDLVFAFSSIMGL